MQMGRRLLQKAWGDNPRTALIRKNIAASLFIKGWSTIVLFSLVPLTLKCLGAYENGVWLTISSMLVWIDSLDIGLGNGLRNKLAESLACGDRQKARQAVSSTFFMLIAVIAPACVLLNALIWGFDMYSFLNVESSIVGNLSTVLSVSVVLVCSTFIFKFIGNFYMGLQMPAINNLLVTVGQTLMFVGTLAVYLSGIHSLLLIALVNTLSPFVVYLVSYPITFRGRYKDLRPSLSFIDRRTVSELFGMGVKFFVLQISGLVLFMSSNVIISNSFSPELVTPYQIAYRYFCVAMLLFNIICTPYWTATTDAYKRGDMVWIKRASRTLDLYLLLMALVVALLMAVSGPVFVLWIGRDVEIPFAMTVIVGVYMLTTLVSMRYSWVLNGVGALNLQLCMTIFAAVIYVPLALGVSALTHDINWLLVVMCIVNVPGLMVNAIQYYKIINGTATGVWRK